MNARGWEVNALQLIGLVKETKARGWYDDALAQCAADVQLSLENPRSQEWHSSHIVQSFGEIIRQQRGSAAVEEMYFQMTSDSFGAVTLSALQISMVFLGRSPGTMFALIPRMVHRGVRNVQCTWFSISENSGTVTFDYPTPVTEITVLAWTGALRYLSGLSGTMARLTEVKKVGLYRVSFLMDW